MKYDLVIVDAGILGLEIKFQIYRLVERVFVLKQLNLMMKW